MTLVFQYGSNCSESQINSDERLRGDAKFISIAETLGSFELAFDVWSRHRGCAAADIVSRAHGKVWGVLYEVPDHLVGRETARNSGRKSLDAVEGEGRTYKREKIRVRRDNGDVVTAFTYRAIRPQPGLKTNREYVRYIVTGLRDHGVNEEYISEVKRIAAANNPMIATEVEAL
jgi:cation transport regulator ChaC